MHPSTYMKNNKKVWLLSSILSSQPPCVGQTVPRQASVFLWKPAWKKHWEKTAQVVQLFHSRSGLIIFWKMWQYLSFVTLGWWEISLLSSFSETQGWSQPFIRVLLLLLLVTSCSSVSFSSTSLRKYCIHSTPSSSHTSSTPWRTSSSAGRHSWLWASPQKDIWQFASL